VADHRHRPHETKLVDVRGPASAVQIPDWLPKPLGVFAQKKAMNLYGPQLADPEALALLRRLTSDPRMKNVWDEMQKHKRKDHQRTEDFFHSAISSSRWFDLQKYPFSPERGSPSPQVIAATLSVHLEASYQELNIELSNQERAMIYFLNQALIFGLEHKIVIPIRHLRKRRDHYLKMARRLRDDASQWTGIETSGLREAAHYYETLAKGSTPPGQFLMRRQPKSDARVKIFVIELAGVTKTVFGNHLCGCLATTANVTFECRALTAATVRKMLRRAPRP
jgi:hypothetical protein